MYFIQTLYTFSGLKDDRGDRGRLQENILPVLGKILEINEKVIPCPELKVLLSGIS
jgi:hypothetical protein